MKQLIIVLKDEEWTELCDTIKHEFGEPMKDEEIETMLKKDVIDFIRATYIHGLGA